MKKNHFPLLLLVLVTPLFLMSACDPSQDTQLGDPVALDANLLKSPKLFESALQERSRVQSNVFKIQDVSRIGDDLVIDLKGGSTAEDFKVIWNGEVLLSYPAMLHLVVVYEGDERDFDPETELSIKVNLNRITPGYTDASQFVFHVYNGSAVAKTVLDPNGTSTEG